MRFETDENRGYLAVTIPVHPSFLSGSEQKRKKSAAYEESIVNALRKSDLTLTELAHDLGYKGITKKLSTAVQALVRKGVLSRVASESESGTKLHLSQ